jgi:hypothetical protein
MDRRRRIISRRQTDDIRVPLYAGTRWTLNRAKAGEAMPSIFGEGGADSFPPSPMRLVQPSSIVSPDELYRFRCRCRCLVRFEDSGPGRQLHAGAIHDITAYGGTPEPFPLASCPRKTSLDPCNNHGALENIAFPAGVAVSIPC